MRLDFSLESGFLRINKHTCKQICPVKLQGRKDWFSYYSLIFSYKQPLQVVVLSVYFPEAPPAAAPASLAVSAPSVGNSAPANTVVATPQELNSFLSSIFCFH